MASLNLICDKDIDIQINNCERLEIANNQVKTCSSASLVATNPMHPKTRETKKQSKGLPFLSTYAKHLGKTPYSANDNNNLGPEYNEEFETEMTEIKITAFIK